MAQAELIGNADAVEFCPCEPYLHILAAASYTLQEGEEPVRLGELYLFSVEKKGSDVRSSSLSLSQVYHRSTSGVFDIKWRPWSYGGASPCLAQASADGTLRLHKLEENGTASLELCETSMLKVSSSMCLFVDWNRLPSDPQVAVSHSDGSLSAIDVGQSEPEFISSWNAHGFEAWIVTYDKWKPQIIYSGGDDSLFCCWDLRETSRPVFADRKTHRMGVCSIQSSPLLENTLVTGSYDESVRLWDLRMVQTPLMALEVGLGGGVWRVKWHHSDPKLLLAACMHYGFAVARVGEGEIEVLERYEEHKSLAYGGSWYRGDWEVTWSADMRASAEELHATSGRIHELDAASDGQGRGDQEEDLAGSEGPGKKIPSPSQTRGSTCLVATCSFYDKALHIWEPTALASRF